MTDVAAPAPAATILSGSLPRRSRRFALAGALILGALVVIALAAPLLAPYDPTDRVGAPFAAPSAAHLLGTNDVGQDLLSELLFGTRISLLVGTAAALAATVIGATVGVTAGYARGWLDGILMRLVDVMLSLPVLPLTIVIGVFAGAGLSTQIFVIAAVTWAGVARELRAQVLSLRERDYIQALRAMGARAGYVLPTMWCPPWPRWSCRSSSWPPRTQSCSRPRWRSWAWATSRPRAGARCCPWPTPAVRS